MLPRSASRLPFVERHDPADIERDRLALEGARQRAALLEAWRRTRDERERTVEGLDAAGHPELDDRVNALLRIGR